MNNQKGFAHLELILIAIAVAGIAGTGYYVYSKNPANNKQLNHSATDGSVDALPAKLTDIKTVDEIRAAAANDLNGASIISVELENEDEGLVYKVKLSNGSVLVFNAKTGASLSKHENQEIEHDDAIPAGFSAGISVEQARQAALNQRPGKSISKIELEVEDGKVVYSVRFTDDGRVDVDASTGAVVRVKDGDNHADDEPADTHSDSDDSGGSSGSSSDHD